MDVLMGFIVLTPEYLHVIKWLNARIEPADKLAPRVRQLVCFQGVRRSQGSKGCGNIGVFVSGTGEFHQQDANFASFQDFPVAPYPGLVRKK